MATKVIVSYDGTANEDDAVAYGGLLARAGAELSLAYVRHTHEPDSNRETLAQHEAEALLGRGEELLGDVSANRQVVTDRSTPEGLSGLARQIGAQVIVFCSDSHTAHGHVTIGNSAQRLLEGGPAAIAIAPVGLADADGAKTRVERIVAVGEPGGDGSAERTAQSLASAFGAQVVPVADDQVDLVVIDSRAGTEPGHVSLSSSAEHLIEITTCPVLVVPSHASLQFGGAPAAATTV